ncbi:uteroglobin [Carlito syrichta]|uniref:Uteroglobin n=1 Tax=Carlito syrichta TaxID=1868482 RepID=A0A1U7TXP6_CARSF|nr:uteroglobin [Carlito syrichta]
MKLTATLSLVTLALLYSSASAEICPGFLHIIENVFMGTLSSYETAVEPFSPDQDMRDAGTQLKKLVDTLPQKARDSVIKFTEKIVKSSLCN